MLSFCMLRRPRHRRGPYALAQEHRVPVGLLRAIVALMLAVVLFLSLRSVLSALGVGNRVQAASVVLVLEQGSSVSVSLDNGAMKRAENGLKLYEGDRVVADMGAALLQFFDGTAIRLDRGSDLTVRASGRGTRTSSIDVRLAQGRLWLRTPSATAFSGAITRTVNAEHLSVDLVADTEAIVSQTSVAIFSAEGQGVRAEADNGNEAIVGEGQMLTLPADLASDADLYAYRTPLDSAALSAFLIESRMGATLPLPGSGSQASAPRPEGDILTVLTPQENERVTTTTVHVSGTVGEGVVKVRVNGYQASLDTERGTFSQELAVAGEEAMEIRIEALDERGLLLREMRRTIQRNIAPVEAPAVTSPAPTGSIYRTQAEELEIRGTAPARAVGIMVNDYRLQLFQPGKGTWSYLASTKLNNFVRGRNTFDIVVIDERGNRSPAARITVLLEDGPTGIVGTDTPLQGSAMSVTSVAVSSSTSTITLQNNAPILPGTLTITRPSGTTGVATGAVIVLEGAVPPGTTGLWVNDYKLQLFSAPQTSWRFIAREEWGTLKMGKNDYVVTARNDKGEVLDTLRYTVERIAASAGAQSSISKAPVSADIASSSGAVR